MNYKPVNLLGYEHRYVATEEGEIVSLQRNGKQGWWPMQGKVKHTGYREVCLSKEGSWAEKNYRSALVHVLVARTFFGMPPKNHEINHKDGNKLNNKVSNLEYVSRSANHLHAHQSGLHNEYGDFRKQAVIATHIETGSVREFYCINEAARMGFKSGAITLCCQGKQNEHHGYTWRYKENRKISAKPGRRARRPVCATHLETGETLEFSSFTEAERAGFHRQNIRKCCQGLVNSHKGYSWKYGQ